MTAAITTGTPTELADAMGRLRRAIRRAVRGDRLHPPLPPSERELLMLVHRSDGIGVGEAADALQVAPNTVSTLVTSLRRAGLLHRRPDPGDRRAARLHLSPAGRARVREVRRRRARVLDEAFDRLDYADRNLLLGALPSLERLIDALSSLDEAQP